MISERRVYFAKPSFYQIIRELGGTWNDSKERPIVCLLKLKNSNLYWAIPMGNWKHRDTKAKERILQYLNRKKSDITSCFYHVGNTTVKSIFFISDVIPITEEYILSEYLGYNGKVYEIKNPKLLKELEYKLKRILMFESKRENYFRQHITDLRKFLERK
ncbi:MAG TPA: hypothetical protein VIG61_01080 [Fusobacterium sp.]|uniref:hypothetical protein n=1 Tax=Fusobacterium sp. TaxID=68766 RepID=UPI002F4078E2